MSMIGWLIKNLYCGAGCCGWTEEAGFISQLPFKESVENNKPTKYFIKSALGMRNGKR